MRMILMVTLLCGMFIFFWGPCIAASDARIDSLKVLLLQQQAEDSTHWQILHDLSRAYAIVSPDSAIIFGQLAIGLADQLGRDEMLFKSYNILGVGYIRKNVEDQAFQYFLKALELSKSHNGKAWKKFQAQALINVAGVFWTQNDMEKALPYAHEARNLLETLDEPRVLADNYQGLGLMYENNAQLDSAIFYLAKALDIYIQLEEVTQQGRVISLMGDIYFKQKHYEKALFYQQRALDIAEKKSDVLSIITTQLDIAKIEIELEKYNEARNKLHHILSLTQSESLESHRASAYGLLSKSFFQQNQFDSAYHYLFTQHELEKELITAEKSKQINELNAVYQTQEKELENQLLRQKNQAIQTRNRYVSLGFLLLMLGIVAIGYSAHKLMKKNEIIAHRNEEVNKLLEELTDANKHLSNLMDEKSQLIGLITHDIQTPLSVIKFTIASLMLEIKNQPVQSDLQAIEFASQQIGYLINRISDLQKSDNVDFTVNIKSTKVQEVIEESSEPYIQWAKKKNIKVDIKNSDQPIEIQTDPFILSKAFSNLLGNAVKFSEPGKTIQVKAYTDDRFLVISVKDEGPGISFEDQQKAFNKYQKLTAKPTFGEPSTGNGLFLSKRYVEALGGQIFMNSELGKGSTFTIRMPLPEKQETKNPESVFQKSL